MSQGLDVVRAGGRELTGRHVLFSLIGFFGVVFAVNGYFLYSALSTHTGVVSVEPYRKGLAYNTRIAAEEQQKGLGWSDTVTVTNDGKITLKLQAADGAPVHAVFVTGLLSRPSTARADRTLQFAAAVGGDYVATVGQLDEGTWIVSAEVRRDARDIEPAYRLRRRVWVKP